MMVSRHFQQAGAELLRRGIGYAMIVTLVVATSTWIQMNPWQRHNTIMGAFSNALMNADLVLSDLATGLVEGAPKTDGHVVVVDIAPHRPNHSLVFPMPRDNYARLLRKLVSLGARVVVFDIVFPRAGEHKDKDADFIAAIRENPGRAMVARLPREGDIIGWDTLMPNLEQAVDDPTLGPGYGATLSLLDVDTVLRRTFIAWDQEQFPGGATLGVRAASRWLGQVVEVTPRTVKSGSHLIALDGGMLELSVPDYRKENLDVSVDEVMEGLYDGTSLFKNRVAVVIPPIDVDSFLVRGQGLHKRRVPGGYILAATIEAVLDGRATIRASETTVYLCSAILTLLMAFGLWRRPTLQGFVLTTVALSGLWAAVVLATLYLKLEWIDAVVPWSAMTASGVLLLAFEGARLRGIFARFLPRQLIEHAMAVGFEGQRKGTTSEATVVFVDLQGYTSISEQLSGEVLVTLINDLHQSIGSVFQQHGGTIIDYMGDAQMIVFGIPTFSEDHAFRAIDAVQAVPAALATLNDRLARDFPSLDHELRVGIGVASGPVTWGFIGAYGHQEFAALGDTTNVAARLQAMTRTYEVSCLISEATYELVKDRVKARPVEDATIRGKTVWQRVYELMVTAA